MQLVFATHNPNKLKEIQSMMPTSIVLLSLKDIGCEEDVPETQDTIEGNAIQKATYIKNTYGYDCFADDTGLEVFALDGEPGVYSARYAGPQRDSDENMSKLLHNLKVHNDRSAQFKTVIALHLDGTTHTFEGLCKGSITREKSGNDGFGYDPIFKAEGYDLTFAEIPLDEKNRIGHRGKAFRKLIDFFKQTSFPK